MAYDKSESRLVVVGEDGSAHKAKTSQQLAAALSVSVWDISNLRQPLLVCTAGSKQVKSQCCAACMHVLSQPALLHSASFTMQHASGAC